MLSTEAEKELRKEAREELLTSWAYNVVDEFKGLNKEQIRQAVQDKSYPYAVMMANVIQDFNFASVIRSANALGVRTVYYYGKKKFDRRGCTGTYHYTEVIYLREEEEVRKLKDKYSFVCLENVPPTQSIYSFDWKTEKMPLICIGEEAVGMPEWVLEIADYRIEIPQRGSVRSMNAAVAGSIAMSDFCFKFISR